MTEARTPSPPAGGDPTATPGPHPLDAATHLAEDGEAGLAGRTHAAYANMVGPFGGVIASTLLNGALVSAQRLGDPVALTVNYAGPIADGAFRLHAQPMRTNRSTQHWSMRASGRSLVAVAPQPSPARFQQSSNESRIGASEGMRAGALKSPTSRTDDTRVAVTVSEISSASRGY